MKGLLTIALIGILYGAAAQEKNVILQSRAYEQNRLNFDSDSLQLHIEGLVTSVRLYWINGKGEIELTSTDEQFILSGKQDPDDLHPNDFIIFKEAVNSFAIKSQIRGTLMLESFYAETITNWPNDIKLKQEGCEQPNRIEPEVWRSGLAEPKPGRNAVVVKHCIVHHAASSNARTDYTAVVRNIYLLHTESNGWDDIGYNYLIAPNGDIYLGRDPLGAADEDNIQGAHFCSKNSGTMGICLIGNYSSLRPSDNMLLSLNQLLTWKLHKENISAFDAFPHPNSNSTELPSIAMHREGCSTVCPGDSVALSIPGIKIEVQSLLDDCAAVSVLPSSKTVADFYPNPNQGVLYFGTAANMEWLEIYDASSRLVLTCRDFNHPLLLHELSSGFYSLKLFKSNGTISFQTLSIQ